MARERKTVKVIIPDASPLLTLGRIGRLDVFRHFVVTIQIVDVVKEEAMRPNNDVTGNVRKWFDAPAEQCRDRRYDRRPLRK